MSPDQTIVFSSRSTRFTRLLRDSNLLGEALRDSCAAILNIRAVKQPFLSPDTAEWLLHKQITIVITIGGACRKRKWIGMELAVLAKYLFLASLEGSHIIIFG